MTLRPMPSLRRALPTAVLALSVLCVLCVGVLVACTDADQQGQAQEAQQAEPQQQADQAQAQAQPAGDSDQADQTDQSDQIDQAGRSDQTEQQESPQPQPTAEQQAQDDQASAQQAMSPAQSQPTQQQQTQGYGSSDAYGSAQEGAEDEASATSVPPVRTWLAEGVSLTPSVPAVRDEYGWSAAIEGDVIAVSAPYHDARGGDTGAVFVFERVDGEWVETAYLVPDYPDPQGWFGRWIALDQGRLVIGAPYEDVIGLDGLKIEDSGVAYVYEQVGGEWRRTGTLLPTAPAGGASFGWSVSIWGDRIAVSAWQDPMMGMQVGSVTTYVQRKGLWQAETVFRPSNPTQRHMFGRDIELHENILVVGAPGDDTIAEDAGALFVWHYYANQWNFAGKLLASDAAAADRLGSQVALDGGWLASGGYDHDDPYWSAGATYVWKLNTLWDFHSKLQPSDLQPGDWFGYSVDIKDDRMVIGAPHRAHPETGIYRSGAAYVFELIDDQWVEAGVLGPVNAIEAGERAEFGWVTEIDGTTAVVGAWLADTDIGGEDAGAAAVYELPTDTEDDNE